MPGRNRPEEKNRSEDLTEKTGEVFFLARIGRVPYANARPVRQGTSMPETVRPAGLPCDRPLAGRKKTRESRNRPGRYKRKTHARTQSDTGIRMAHSGTCRTSPDKTRPPEGKNGVKNFPYGNGCRFTSITSPPCGLFSLLTDKLSENRFLPVLRDLKTFFR